MDNEKIVADGRPATISRRQLLLRYGARLFGVSLLLGMALVAARAQGGGAGGAAAPDAVGAEETDTGNLVADALRAAASADAALVPAAAFKRNADVPRPVRAERAAGLVETPDDAIVVLGLRGAQILGALERSVSLAPQRNVRFLQVSGIRFAFNSGKPAGQRVQSVTVGGSPLDPNRTYKVATTRPLAHGQQGYSQIWDRGQITAETGKTLATALADFVRARGGSVSPATDQRIAAAGR